MPRSIVSEPSGPVSMTQSGSCAPCGFVGDGEHNVAPAVVEFDGREADREQDPSLFIETRQLVGTRCLRELHRRVMHKRGFESQVSVFDSILW